MLQRGRGMELFRGCPDLVSRLSLAPVPLLLQRQKWAGRRRALETLQATRGKTLQASSEAEEASHRRGWRRKGTLDTGTSV